MKYFKHPSITYAAYKYVPSIIAGLILLKSQEHYQIELLKLTRLNYRWQSKEAKGFAADDFTVDWQKQSVICPGGKISASWTPAIDGRDSDVIKIKFSSTDCSVCPSASSGDIFCEWVE
jgi:hypothetical protein